MNRFDDRRSSWLTGLLSPAIFILTATLSFPSGIVRADSFGTGFFVTSNGYIVTNHHVVEDSDQFSIRYQGSWIPVRLMQSDPDNDLAILKADGNSYSSLPIDFSPDIQPGDTVFTVGFPDPTVLGFSPKTTRGAISALTGLKDNVRFYQTTVAIQPGNSGGPLCDEAGNVVGVTTATVNALNRIQTAGYVPQNVNFGLKSSYIRPLLESVSNSMPNIPPLASGLSFRDAQKKVENAVVSVRAKSSEPEVTTVAPSGPATPPAAPPAAPKRTRLQVTYGGSDGINIRDTRVINSESNLHGALFPQSTFPLYQVGDLVRESSREWVQLEVTGWVPVKNTSRTFLTPLGNNQWKVNRANDGFVAMRTGTASTFPLVCKLSFSTVLEEVDRDFSDPDYHYILGRFRGWAVKRSTKEEYFRYVND